MPRAIVRKLATLSADGAGWSALLHRRGLHEKARAMQPALFCVCPARTPPFPYRAVMFASLASVHRRVYTKRRVYRNAQRNKKTVPCSWVSLGPSRHYNYYRDQVWTTHATAPLLLRAALPLHAIVTMACAYTPQVHGRGWVPWRRFNSCVTTVRCVLPGRGCQLSSSPRRKLEIGSSEDWHRFANHTAHRCARGRS